MTSQLRERPSYRLAAHFFQSLFDFGFLSEDAAEAFTRVVIGVASLLVTFGILVARLYLGRYRGLSADGYAHALLADETMIVAFPMFASAFATVLVSASLFPTETDYRVLVPLPITRRAIFGAKLAGVAAFLGLFVAAFGVSLGPLFMLVSHGRWQRHALVARILAHALAAAMASGFAALAMTMIFGVITLCAPRSAFRVMSGVVQTLLVCALILVLPLMLRLPAYRALYGSGSRTILLVPPAWFIGIERTLLREPDRLFGQLAAIGETATLVVFVGVFACYAMLYRRFDHVLTRPNLAGTLRWPRLPTWRVNRGANSPPRMAIQKFTSATLARSTLHRGVFAAITAFGVGFVVNSLLNAGFSEAPRVERRLWEAITWAPFPVMFSVVIALRASLLLPIEQRANWLFRMTEADATRRQQLDAVERTLLKLGVAVPLIILLPVEWLTVGPMSLLLLAVAALCGAILVELVLFEWRRLPFSSAYMPGKRAVGLTLLAGFASFAAYSSVGAGLGRTVVRGNARGSSVVFALLVALYALSRWRRLRTWGRMDLLFEDELPEDITPIRLH
jgi:hypothetical protein